MSQYSQEPGPLGLQPNIAAMLTYAPCYIGLILSIIFFAIEKNNRLVRFHAIQSLIFHGALFVVSVGLSFFLSIVGHLGLFGGIISSLGSFFFFAILVFLSLGVSVFLMIKANAGEMTKLPIIGDVAAKNA